MGMLFLALFLWIGLLFAEKKIGFVRKFNNKFRLGKNRIPDCIGN
jgi:hypothetical protein